VFLVTLQTAQAKPAYAYIANNSANTVSVVDIANNTVVKTIPVGNAPYGVAVNQAGTSAYVTNSGSNTVSVISTSTNNVVATVNVQSGPLDIAITPSGKTVYVSNGNSNSVSVINTGTKKVTANIPVQNPVGLAVNPNGAFLYVVSSGPGNVLVISTLTNAIVTTISVGTNIPVAMVISPDGATAYVTNYNAQTVSVIRTADNAVINTINVGAGPFGASISPDGHWLYVANYNAGGGNLVTVVDTRSQTVAGTVVVGTGPERIGFTQDSRFSYVSNITSNNVSLIDTASRTVVKTFNAGSTPIGVGLMGLQKVSTVAGGYVGDKGPATSAAIGAPYFSVFDSAGNLFISDFMMNRIRKVDTSGTITTYAGTGICGYNGENILASKAMVCYPNGLAMDNSGNLIYAEGGRIRKIDHASKKVVTIAGTGAFGNTGDGGPALQAQINQPFNLTYDATGNLFFTEVGSCVVRKIDTADIISTVAGNGTCGYGGDGGPATSAMLNLPRGVAVDANGNVYIGDTANHRVRKVSGGVITTFAGTGGGGFSGDGGLATAAAIGNPVGLLVHNGLLYIANAGRSRFRTVDLSTHIINTYAGSSFGYDGDGNPLLTSRFASPRFMHFDAAGNPVFDDSFNGRLRKANGGIVSTIAGGYLGDGQKATSAAFVLPEALAVDKSGSLFIADWTGSRIRKVSGGTMSTLAGASVNGYSGDGGPATSALLNQPLGVAVDSAGNVLIADTNNAVVRKVTAGTISTLAADPNFCDLLQMATDSANNVYIADDCASVIFKVTPGGVVSVVAGVLFTSGYNGDNIPATAALLNGPTSVAIDASDNLLIADYGNNRVRVVAGGIISTVAGDGVCNYAGDGGSATSAELCPWSVAVNKSGTIFVDDNFQRVRKIANGTITTFAGTGTANFNGDKLWPLLTGFDDIVAVAVDSKNTVYALDDVEHRVRTIK